VKTFDDLYAELADKARTRPAGSGTVAAVRVSVGVVAARLDGIPTRWAPSVFVRCGLADSDPAFPRYPALPTLQCRGYCLQRPSAPR
jgi:hypothetical protein